MKKPRLTPELHCFHCFLSRPTPPVPKTFGLFCFMVIKIAFIIKQTLAMITSQMSDELFLIAADSSHPSRDHPCVRRQGCHDSKQSMPASNSTRLLSEKTRHTGIAVMRAPDCQALDSDMSSEPGLSSVVPN